MASHWAMFFSAAARVVHAVGAVDLLGDGLDLLLDRLVDVVERLEGRLASRRAAPGPPWRPPRRLPRPWPRRRSARPARPSPCAAWSTASISSSVSEVKRLSATTTGTPNFCTFLTCASRFTMPRLSAAHVRRAERVLLDAAVHLERPHRGDDDRRLGLEPAEAALDVEELLGAEIGAEAGLGEHDVAERERRAWWRRCELQPCAMLPNGPRAPAPGRPRASARGWAGSRP